LSQFKKVFFEEVASIRGSLYKQSLLFYLPFLTFMIVWYIFYRGLSVDLPIVVIDQDKTPTSRTLVHNLDATQSLAVVYKLQNFSKAQELLRTSKAYAIVVIPADFAKDVTTHKDPQVVAFVNAQYILIGKLIGATLKGVMMEYNIKLHIGSEIAKQQNIQKALAQLAPIQINITEFFNQNGNYFYFLIIAILPAMWQIFITVGMIVAFGECVKQKQCQSFFKEGILSALLGRMLPYSVVYTLWGVLIVLSVYGVYGWEFYGAFSGVFLAVVLCVLAYESIALLFLFGGGDYARSLSLAAVYTAPAFAFLGITFPTLSMNAFAQFWNEALPITHFMQLLLQEANYGVSGAITTQQLVALGLFDLLFVLVVAVVAVRVRR